MLFACQVRIRERPSPYECIYMPIWRLSAACFIVRTRLYVCCSTLQWFSMDTAHEKLSHLEFLCIMISLVSLASPFNERAITNHDVYGVMQEASPECS